MAMLYKLNIFYASFLKAIDFYNKHEGHEGRDEKCVWLWSSRDNSAVELVINRFLIFLYRDFGI